MKMAGKVLVAIVLIVAMLFVSAPAFAQLGSPFGYGGYGMGSPLGYSNMGQGLGYGGYGAYPGMGVAQGNSVPMYGDMKGQVPYSAANSGLGKGMNYGGNSPLGYGGLGKGAGYGGMGGYGPMGYGGAGYGLGYGGIGGYGPAGFGGLDCGLGNGGFPLGSSLGCGLSGWPFSAIPFWNTF